MAVKTTLAGLKVVGITTGPYWNYADDYAQTKYDEWGVAFNRKYDHPLTLSTFTLRQNSNQFALPVRRNTTGQLTSLGYGVGGRGQPLRRTDGPVQPLGLPDEIGYREQVWTGLYEPSHPEQRHPGLAAQYDDYLPYYKDWEQAIGITGTNQEPFIPDSSYPMPSHPDTPLGAAFRDATEAMGYHPFPPPPLWLRSRTSTSTGCRSTPASTTGGAARRATMHARRARRRTRPSGRSRQP